MTSSHLLLRALRGPIFLITVGTLFALDQSLGIGMDRTWPVFLIAFGLLALIERITAPPRTPPPPYVGGEVR